MPSVLRVHGFRFHFYANEGREPPHIHVRSAEGAAKFWLLPVALAGWRRYDHRALNVIEALVTEHREDLLNAWHAYFGNT